MGLDVRLPIGMLFTVLGLLLTAFGFLSNPSLYAQSLGVNVNLRWGMVLFFFGLFMLYLATRRKFFRARLQQAKPKEKEPQS